MKIRRETQQIFLAYLPFRHPRGPLSPLWPMVACSGLDEIADGGPWHLFRLNDQTLRPLQSEYVDTYKFIISATSNSPAGQGSSCFQASRNSSLLFHILSSIEFIPTGQIIIYIGGVPTRLGRYNVQSNNIESQPSTFILTTDPVFIAICIHLRHIETDIGISFQQLGEQEKKLVSPFTLQPSGRCVTKSHTRSHVSTYGRT